MPCQQLLKVKKSRLDRLRLWFLISVYLVGRGSRRYGLCHIVEPLNWMFVTSWSASTPRQILQQQVEVNGLLVRATIFAWCSFSPFEVVWRWIYPSSSAKKSKVNAINFSFLKTYTTQAKKQTSHILRLNKSAPRFPENFLLFNEKLFNLHWN